jgi:hypothetical protein
MDHIATPRPEASIGGNYTVLRFANGHMLVLHFGPNFEFKPEVAYEIATGGGFSTCNIAVMDGHGLVLDEQRRAAFFDIAGHIAVTARLKGDDTADRVFAEKRLKLKHNPLGREGDDA